MKTRSKAVKLAHRLLHLPQPFLLSIRLWALKFVLLSNDANLYDTGLLRVETRESCSTFIKILLLPPIMTHRLRHLPVGEQECKVPWTLQPP